MYDHLSPKVALIAERSDAERIAYCKKRPFISTDFTKRVIEDARELIKADRDGTCDCRALIGDTGMGKTTLIQAIVAACNTPESQLVEVVDLAIFGRDADLRQIFLSHLGFQESPQKLATTDGVKRIKARVAELGTRMFIWDEANCLPAATRHIEANLAFLRAMSNADIGLNVMVAGTAGVSTFLKKTDSLPSRFGRLEMQNWRSTSLSLSLFLNGYVRYLPLREPSVIDSVTTQNLIISLSGHLTRDITRLLSDASVYGIKHGTEHLTDEIIEASYYEALAFYAPGGVIGAATVDE